MILTKLFQSIGIPIISRNFMVDYCDSHGNHFHKPMQTITPPECLEDNFEIVDRIRSELRQHGFTVCGISEVLGDFEMDELENIFNGSDYGKYPMRALYIDVEMAKKEARP
ncbi:hypothetical protein K250101E9_40720 [Enterocloster aldenensis]|uniref:hypothetical protein n=1 Tax=Enterocloster aldenensis TaxID=358742 RepID=UPI0034BE1388